MNILKHELKLYFKSTLIWVVSLVVIMLFFTAIYPSFKDSAEAMNKILESFPDSFKKALGMSTMDLSSMLGFFGFMFTYVMLVGGVQAMNLGLSILSNEQRVKTADFLLAKPVKRIKVLHAKLGAGVIYILATNVIFSVSTFILLNMMADSDLSNTILFLFFGSLLMVQLFFFSFGMFVSTFMDKLKTVTPISLGAVFGFFIVNMLNESLDGTPLSAFTPFAYFKPTYIYEHVAYDGRWLILNAVLVVGFTVGAYVKYIKKDIPSV